MESEARPPLDQGSAPGVQGPPQWLPGASEPFGATPEPVGGSDPVAPPMARKPRRAGMIAAVVLLCAAVICLGVAVGEWATRTAEADALVDEIERSEAAMVTAMATVGAVLEQEGTGEGSLSEPASAELRAAADAAREEVAAAAEAIAGQPVQPWHTDVLAARDAYLAHNLAWQEYLSRAGADAAAWFIEDSAIESTWNAFTAKFETIVPTPAFGSLPQRVQAIIDDGDPPGDGGSTLQA